MLFVTKDQVSKMKEKVLVLEESLHKSRMKVVREASIAGCEVQDDVFEAAGSQLRSEILILEAGIESAVHILNVQAAIDLID